jgi:hypothetical protein
LAKLSNFAENFSLSHQGQLFCLQQRELSETDTLYFEMSKMKNKSYRLHLEFDNMPANAGKAAVFADEYLSTILPVNIFGETQYNFDVNLANASANANRFKLLLRPLVDFAQINIEEKNGTTYINWHVNDEISAAYYDVERSDDGVNYTSMGLQKTAGNHSYTVQIQGAKQAVNWYRVKCTGKFGEVLYSAGKMLVSSHIASGVTVIPNPVTNQSFGMMMRNMAKGQYQLLLQRVDGVVLHQQSLFFDGNAQYLPIRVNHTLPQGIYTIKLLLQSRNVSVIKIVVK